MDFDGYRQGQHEVIRRFRDFTWLKYRLRSQYKGILPPPLPEKNVLEKYKMAAEFIEQRRAALEVYLIRIAAHSVLSRSPDFRLFLQSDENEFAIEASRSAAEAGDAAPAASGGAANAARKTLHGAVKLFRSLSQQAANLAASGSATSPPDTTTFAGVSHTDASDFSGNLGHAGAQRASSVLGHQNSEERADYVETRAYISDLENHMEEAHVQACKVVKHYSKLASSLAEFGAALTVLARRQGSSPLKDAPLSLFKGAPPPLASSAASQTLHSNNSNGNGLDAAASHLARLSQRVLAVSSVCQKASESLSRSFEAPMREFLRQVKSAKKAMSDRSEALAAKRAARNEVDARRGRLARLRGTIGIREERVIEAERDLQVAHTKAEAMSRQYEAISERMDGDIGRFQKERIEEMRSVLFDFAVTQAKTSSDIACVWGGVV